MTEHIAPHAPATEVAHDYDGGHHDGHHSPEAIRQEVRVYLVVFGSLMVLTAATVFACYGLKLPIQQAVIVALSIACMKGFLVAGFFMHLLSEKKLIYGILILTVVFFAVLLYLPVHDVIGKF